MTRKHFQAIADSLKSMRPGDYELDEDGTQMGCSRCEQWDDDCQAVADALALSNPRFNRDRFLTACGVE